MKNKELIKANKELMKTNIDLIIFDLDETLIKTKGSSIYVYKFVEPLLKYLKSKNVKIALASYNTEAIFILDNLNIHHYFDIIEYENWYHKMDYKEKMLKNILYRSKVSPNKILFLDDQKPFLSTAENIGIMTRLMKNGNIKECLDGFININHLTF